MNYSEAVEALINKQINMEFYAEYVYLAMASFFARDEQALHGFAKFFRKSADEEREHALKLAHYQAQRGGRVVFQVIFKKIIKYILKGMLNHNVKRAGFTAFRWIVSQSVIALAYKKYSKSLN